MTADLFVALDGSPQHVPLAGADVRWYPGYLEPHVAAAHFEALTTSLAWEQPTLVIAGRTHSIPRLQAWHGEPDAAYRYSGRRFEPQPFTPLLRDLNQRLGALCGAAFNSVLVNWYRDGRDSMGYHADDEPELGEAPVIASLTLGGTRRFRFRPQGGGPGVGLDLASGDLLVMAGATQRLYQHAVPKTARAVAGRVNLTFRAIGPGGSCRDFHSE